jgi:hypothetical protein
MDYPRELCFQFLDRVWSLHDMLSEYEKDRVPDILDLLPCKRGDGCAADGGGSRVDILMQILARLDNDMMTAESILRHLGEGDWPFDRLKLRSVLRWGYLASPKFYWMARCGD